LAFTLEARFLGERTDMKGRLLLRHETVSSEGSYMGNRVLGRAAFQENKVEDLVKRAKRANDNQNTTDPWMINLERYNSILGSHALRYTGL
jgi:hypothetical protein